MKLFNKAKNLVDGVVDGVKGGIENADKKAKDSAFEEAVKVVRAESDKTSVCVCCGTHLEYALNEEEA